MNCNFYYLYNLLSTFQLIKTYLQQTLECMISSHIIIKMKVLFICLVFKKKICFVIRKKFNINVCQMNSTKYLLSDTKNELLKLVGNNSQEIRFVKKGSNAFLSIIFKVCIICQNLKIIYFSLISLLKLYLNPHSIHQFINYNNYNYYK